VNISGQQGIYRLVSAVCFLLLTAVSCSGSSQPAAPVQQPAVGATAQPSPEVIYLHYNERPPYLVTTQNGVEGLVGGRTSAVFEKSNLPFVWVQTPSKRQIYILQQNTGRNCLPGWFKTADRETFAKYTVPIYQDEPQIALTRARNDEIPATTTVDEIFKRSELTLLVKDGYSYGSFLDQKMAELDPARIETTVENSGMLKMIYAGHADYFFIAPEEAEGVITASGYELQDFKEIHFTDITEGENRYILCDFQIDDATIDLLNEAIRQYADAPSE
jgi:polar amino acid transport system substrate-binding protein